MLNKEKARVFIPGLFYVDGIVGRIISAICILFSRKRKYNQISLIKKRSIHDSMILKKSATQPWNVRWGFETTYDQIHK